MDEQVLTTVATALGNAALHGRSAASSLLASHVLASPALANAALASAALASGTPPQLPGFLNSLAPLLNHYGVWAIVLLVFLEDFGIPVPGETVLIAGAVFAGSGQLNIVMVGIAGFLAAIAGDNVGYAIGRFGGRALVDRWGKYIFLTPERMDKAEDFFNRHGGKIIAIARFVEGLRQANGLIAGIIEMHWLKFVAFNALGAALWVGTWVSVGYFAGQHITAIYNAISRYSLYAAIAAAVVIVAWIGLHVRQRRRAKAARTARATTDVAPPEDTLARAPGAGTVAEGAGTAVEGAATVDEGEGTVADGAGPGASAQDGPGDAGGTADSGTADAGPAAEGPKDNSARS